MRELKLTKGLVALVDDEDYDRVKCFKWQALKGNTTYYAVRNRNKDEKGNLSDRLHRFILGVTSSEDLVDHIDHNGLNNQKNNLRICSYAGNARNQLPREGGTSRYKGVCLETSTGRYKAAIAVDGKPIRLGRFTSSEQAAEAYNEAAVKYHGEFACLNIINEDAKEPLGREKRLSASQHTGVTHRGKEGGNKPWKAIIHIGNKKRLYIGVFETELEAAAAYNEMREKYPLPQRKSTRSKNLP